MAEFFTNFSRQLPVGSFENAARAMEIYNHLQTGGDPDSNRIEFIAEHDAQSPGVIWLHDDVSGEPEQVIQFVLQCAAELKLSGRWGFDWSYSCSRPYLDAFGGGAVVLDLGTGQTVAELSTHLWLHEHLETGGDHG